MTQIADGAPRSSREPTIHMEAPCARYSFERSSSCT
jgi:hypothetical protein